MHRIEDPYKNLGPIGEWMVQQFKAFVLVMVAVTIVWILMCVFVFPQKTVAFSSAVIYVAAVGFAISRVWRIRSLREGRPPRSE